MLAESSYEESGEIIPGRAREAGEISPAVERYYRLGMLKEIFGWLAYTRQMEMFMRSAKRIIAITTLAALAAICAVPLTAAAAGRWNFTADNSTPIEIELPVSAAGTASVDLIEQGDRTRILVSLTDLPSDLATPSLIAEIHHGICGNLRRAPDYAVESTLSTYLPAPYYVGGIFPVSLASLRDGAHAISVRTGPEAGSVELACGNIR